MEAETVAVGFDNSAADGACGFCGKKGEIRGERFGVDREDRAKD